MRKMYIIFVAMVLSNISKAQGWELINPVPMGNNLQSVFFTDPNTGYAVGGAGTILKTTNGGYPVGINETQFNIKKLRVFPNPSSTRITIEINNKGSLSILNLSGQHLLQQEITGPPQPLVSADGRVEYMW
jgi:hypothetical protein